MSVKLINNNAFYGYRVRRTVNGKLYQEYFSLKNDNGKMSQADGKVIEEQANLRDQELKVAQKRAKLANKESRCFRDDGTVKGISFLIKQEKSGTITPIFQVGLQSELEDKIICTSYSINAHGMEGAWRKAAECFCEHKNINMESSLADHILAAMPIVDASEKMPPAEMPIANKYNESPDNPSTDETEEIECFFEITGDDGEHSFNLNESHPFYTESYTHLGREGRKAVEYLLASFVNAKDELYFAEDTLNHLVKIWSKRMDAYID